MAGTQHTDEYRSLIHSLVDTRHKKGISQTDLAKVLRKNRSFIAKVELCERRLDVIEFCIWVRALGENPSDFIRLKITELPKEIPTDQQ